MLEARIGPIMQAVTCSGITHLIAVYCSGITHLIAVYCSGITHLILFIWQRSPIPPTRISIPPTLAVLPYHIIRPSMLSHITRHGIA